MGMFDYVVCKRRLPDGYKPKDGKFQTKDFPDPYMETYTIRRDGRLVGPGIGPSHFTLNFCDSGPDGEWHEYEAVFELGPLVEIKKIEKGHETPNQKGR